MIKKSKKKIRETFENKIGKHFHDILIAKYSPHSIALGFALGTFLAIFPTPGLSIAIGFLSLFLFIRINKLSMMAAFAIWNPITLIPIYFVSYHIGRFVVGELPEATIRIKLIGYAYNLTRTFLVGNILLSILFGLGSYFLVRWVVTIYYKKKALDLPEDKL